jgi:hypothetical protein
MQPDDSPDIIMGNDKLDQFWYVASQGTNGADRLYLVEHAGWMWCGGGGGVGRNMAITKFQMMVLSFGCDVHTSHI